MICALQLLKDMPVNFWMLSSHLPLCLFLGTVLCRMVFAKPDNLVLGPYYIMFLFFTMLNKLSHDSKGYSFFFFFFFFFLTSLFVMWSLYKMLKIFMVASHLKGFNKHLEVSIEHPRFTILKKDKCVDEFDF